MSWRGRRKGSSKVDVNDNVVSCGCGRNCSSAGELFIGDTEPSGSVIRELLGEVIIEQ